MSELVPVDRDALVRDLEARREQLRGYIGSELGALVRTLQPYVDGTFGQVSPRHVEVLLKALKMLGDTHRVFAPVSFAPEVSEVGAGPDPVAVEAAVAVLRERVVGQLEALEGKGG